VTDREWREAVDLKPRWLWLTLILVAATVLRFWGLRAGIPYALGIDEPEIMERVLTIMRSGDYNPHFFHYPGLAFYLHLPVAILRFATGVAQGEWDTLNGLAAAPFYLWSRGLTAALGVVTVLLVHHVAMRWGARHALLAAGLMAVMPLHVRESHYVLTDVPMTLMVTLTWLLALGAHERGTWGAFAVAGAAAGLATSIKYQAGLAVLLPLLSVWFTVPTRPSRLAGAVAVVAGFAGAFLLTSPYTVLDLSGFLNSFAELLRSFRPREVGEHGLIVYLKHLRLNLGWPAVLLALSGAALTATRAVRGPGRLRWTLLLAFPLVFLWIIAGRHQIYARYLLPITPFLCVLVSVGVISGVSLLRRFDIPRSVRAVLIAALTVAVILPPALNALRFLRMIGRPSTLEATYTWFMTNVPAGSRVVIENFDLRLPGDRYRVTHEVSLARKSIEDYRRDGVDYLVFTSRSYAEFLEDPSRNPQLAEAYRTLFRQAPEVARFDATGGRIGPQLRVLALETP
jgi:4-amino-4-deoxy-L-arabinose transferase-like glycosyltransferase